MGDVPEDAEFLALQLITIDCDSHARSSSPIRLPAMKLRTFIAVSHPRRHPRRALAAARQARRRRPDVKWVEPQSLHWTLQFLGNVEQREIGEICAAVAEARSNTSRSTSKIRGAGAFPSPDRPRTLWLGVGQGRDEMIALQASIEKSLEPLGFRGEARRYTPHLTIGRPGRGEPPRELAAELAAMADFDGGTMLVDEVTILFQRAHARRPGLRAARLRAAGVKFWRRALRSLETAIDTFTAPRYCGNCWFGRDFSGIFFEPSLPAARTSPCCSSAGGGDFPGLKKDSWKSARSLCVFPAFFVDVFNREPHLHIL